jgi:hypothetical protein
MPRHLNTSLDPTQIGPDTPLRLKKAAEIAFPDGGMTVSGLRRERDRGNLVVEKIAGKEFTTLHYIEEMRKKCRVEQKVHDYGCSQPERAEMEKSLNKPSGSSATARSSAALDAARAKLNKLRSGFEIISTPNRQSASATVTPLPSPSRT